MRGDRIAVALRAQRPARARDRRPAAAPGTGAPCPGSGVDGAPSVAFAGSRIVVAWAQRRGRAGRHRAPDPSRCGASRARRPTTATVRRRRRLAAGPTWPGRAASAASGSRSSRACAEGRTASTGRSIGDRRRC